MKISLTLANQPVTLESYYINCLTQLVHCQLSYLHNYNLNERNEDKVLMLWQSIDIPPANPINCKCEMKVELLLEDENMWCFDERLGHSRNEVNVYYCLYYITRDKILQFLLHSSLPVVNALQKTLYCNSIILYSKPMGKGMLIAG